MTKMQGKYLEQVLANKIPLKSLQQSAVVSTIQKKAGDRTITKLVNAWWAQQRPSDKLPRSTKDRIGLMVDFIAKMD